MNTEDDPFEGVDNRKTMNLLIDNLASGLRISKYPVGTMLPLIIKTYFSIR